MENLFKKIDVKDLDEFLEKYNPNITKAVNKYKGSGVDKTVLESKAENIALKALKSYDPKKSNFQTHLFNNLRTLYGEVNKLQGVSRMSEYKKLKYNKNDPFYSKQQGFGSGLGDLLENDDFGIRSGLELKKIVYSSDFGPTEKKVVDLIMESKEELKSSEIAKKLNLSVDRVTKIKKQLSEKIGPILQKKLRNNF